LTRMSRDEEIRLIKSFPLEEYLLRFHGLRVAWRSPDKVYCWSPLREETNPSFVIYPETNTWFDFGLGKGGSVIDFELEVQGGDYAGAMRVLRERILPLSGRDSQRSPGPSLDDFIPRRNRLGWEKAKNVLRKVHGIAVFEVHQKLYRDGRIIMTRRGELVCPMVLLEPDGGVQLCGVAVRDPKGRKRISGRRGVSWWSKLEPTRLGIFEGVRDALAFLSEVDQLDCVVLHGTPSREQLITLRHLVDKYAGDVIVCRDADSQGEVIFQRIRKELKGVAGVWNYPPPVGKDWYEYCLRRKVITLRRP